MTCDRCGELTTDGEHGWLKCPLRTERELAFHTRKEGLYEFTTTVPGTNQPVRIESKQQWRTFMKTHGLTDDFNSNDSLQRDAQRQRRDRHAAQVERLTPQILRKLART